MYCAEHCLVPWALRQWYYIESVKQIVPMEQLYCCFECKHLICERDIQDEIEVYECFQCLRTFSKKHAMVYRHCCYQCLDCPVCRNVLSSATLSNSSNQEEYQASSPSAIKRTELQSDSNMILLVCQYCSWTSEHLNLVATTMEDFVAQIWKLRYQTCSLIPFIEELQQNHQARLMEYQFGDDTLSLNFSQYEQEKKDSGVFCSQIRLVEDLPISFKKDLISSHLDEQSAMPLDKILNQPCTLLEQRPNTSVCCANLPYPKPLHVKRSRRCKNVRYLVKWDSLSTGNLRVNESAIAFLPLFLIQHVNLKKPRKDPKSYPVIYHPEDEIQVVMEILNLNNPCDMKIELIFNDRKFEHVNTLQCLTANLVFSLESYDEFLDQRYEYGLNSMLEEKPELPGHRKTVQLNFRTLSLPRDTPQDVLASVS